MLSRERFAGWSPVDLSFCFKRAKTRMNAARHDDARLDLDAREARKSHFGEEVETAKAPRTPSQRVRTPELRANRRKERSAPPARRSCRTRWRSCTTGWRI